MTKPVKMLDHTISRDSSFFHFNFLCYKLGFVKRSEGDDTMIVNRFCSRSKEGRFGGTGGKRSAGTVLKSRKKGGGG